MIVWAVREGGGGERGGGADRAQREKEGEGERRWLVLVIWGVT